jgi:succinate dehydrogenase / fumarate reductase cytochrome b subunit
MSRRRPPKYLNVFRIRLPVPGLVSILHRISGAALFLFAWAPLWVLQTTLESAEGYRQVAGIADHWIAKLFMVAMLWAFLHHFFAGLRFLLLDVHVGVGLATARALSWAVLAVSLALTILMGAWLW